jgi:hypothetical protein
MHPKNPFAADLEQAEQRLSQVPFTTRRLVTSVQYLRRIDEEGTVPLVLLLSAHKGVEQDYGSTYCAVRDEVDLVALKANAILAKVLPTEEYQAALAEVEPLAAEVERLTAESQAWETAELARINEARLAREAAIAAAMEKIDSRHPVAEVA